MTLTFYPNTNPAPTYLPKNVTEFIWKIQDFAPLIHVCPTGENKPLIPIHVSRHRGQDPPKRRRLMNCDMPNRFLEQVSAGYGCGTRWSAAAEVSVTTEKFTRLAVFAWIGNLWKINRFYCCSNTGSSFPWTAIKINSLMYHLLRN